MEIKNYDDLIEMVRLAPMVTGAITACDDHTIEAAVHAYQKQILRPIFIGDETLIRTVLKDLSCQDEPFEILDEKDPKKTALIACDLVHEGRASVVMKGLIDTSDFLRGILDKERGLRTGRPMSHVAILQIPNYPKLIATTDGGMITAPDYEAKVHIVENVVDMFRGMGYNCPKIAALAAVEKPNKSMPETLDARRLQEANEAGEIKNCVIEGPVSYDVAVDIEAAKKKNFQGKYSGDYDIFLMPNISAGNIMSKALILHAGAKMSGIVLGASVPLVLNSRSASAEEKFYAIVLSVASTLHK